MLDLSPTKLLVVLIVAVVIVGPQRLPRGAHQFAKGWRRLRELNAEIDREVRRSIPGLPPDVDLLRYARSPLALLDRVVDAGPEHTDPDIAERNRGVELAHEGEPPASEAERPETGDPLVPHAQERSAPRSPSPRPVAESLSIDDPCLN